MVHAFGIDNVLSGVRALLAKDLAKLGYSQKEISEILGTSPAAVTLYSKDRRGLQLSKIIKSDAKARVVINDLMESLTHRKSNANAGGEAQKDTFPLILDATYRIMRMVSFPTEGHPVQVRKVPSGGYSDPMTETLLERLQEEQLAAERNMALAISMTDEVARTIFRQIASDSIRHAEIVSFLLNTKTNESKNKPRKMMIQEEIAQVEAMIRGEESATEEPINIKGVDPAVKLLLKSIEMDEEKHKVLLNGLLSISKSKVYS